MDALCPFCGEQIPAEVSRCPHCRESWGPAPRALAFEGCIDVDRLSPDEVDEFTKAYLRGAELSGAFLSGADLFAAYLVGANLRGADLGRANLSSADLKKADLHGANLYGADLHEADLCGADLREANLKGVELHGASYDQFTRWPVGFDPKTVGAVEVSFQ